MTNTKSQNEITVNSATEVVVKKQRKKRKKKLDLMDEDTLYFVLDKDEKEVFLELGLNNNLTYFD